MIEIKITNTKTNQIFGSTFSTKEEADAWHELNKEIHGDESLDPPTAIVEYIDITKKLKIEQLWKEINDFLESEFDSNCRLSMNLLLNDPNTTQEQLTKIIAVGNWWKTAWEIYKANKDSIMNDLETDTDKITQIGKVPYTIWDITN